MHYGMRHPQRNGYRAGELSIKMEVHPNYTPSSKLLLFLNPIRDSPKNNLNFWVFLLKAHYQTSIFKLLLFIHLFVYFRFMSLHVAVTPWPPVVAFLLSPCGWNMDPVQAVDLRGKHPYPMSPLTGPCCQPWQHTSFFFSSFLYSFWDSRTIQPQLFWHSLYRAAWLWTRRDWPTSACWVLGLKEGAPRPANRAFLIRIITLFLIKYLYSFSSISI